MKLENNKAVTSIFKGQLWQNKKHNYTVKTVLSEQDTVFVTLTASPDYPPASFDRADFFRRFAFLAAGKR